MITDQQKAALNRVSALVIKTIDEASPAPAGPLYAALQTQGCTLSQFQSLMSVLVRKGYVQSGPMDHTYVATEAGRQYVKQIESHPRTGEANV